MKLIFRSLHPYATRRKLSTSCPFDIYQGHKIARISVFQVDLPLHELTYKWSQNKSVTSFDATVVKVETDSGYVGYGESTPLGPSYLPAYAQGSTFRVVGTSPHYGWMNPLIIIVM